jgi:hypothetical protein
MAINIRQPSSKATSLQGHNPLPQGNDSPANRHIHSIMRAALRSLCERQAQHFLVPHAPLFDRYPKTSPSYYNTGIMAATSKESALKGVPASEPWSPAPNPASVANGKKFQEEDCV